MKENQKLINPAAYKRVTRIMDDITRAIQVALIDYLVLQSHEIFAKAVAYLGFESQYVQEYLAMLPEEFRRKVVCRAAELNRSDKIVVEEVEHLLRLSGMNVYDDYNVIEENIALNGDEVAEKLYKKFIKQTPLFRDRLNSCIIKFEQLDNKLDDNQFRKLAERTDTSDLVKALYGTSDKFKNKYLSYYPENHQKLLREDMDFAGPVSDKARDEARARIIQTVIDMRYDDIDLPQ